MSSREAANKARDAREALDADDLRYAACEAEEALDVACEDYRDSDEADVHDCPCPSCDETTTDLDGDDWEKGDDGQYYCPDCADYSVDPDSGDVICSSHDVPSIDWGSIQTGGPGVANYQVGRDADGREWITEDRGGWTVPRPRREDD